MSADHEPAVVEHPATLTVVVRSGDLPVEGMIPFFDESFSAIGAALGAQEVRVTGPAFARYLRPMAATADLEVGLPVASPIRPDGVVEPGELPAVRVVRTVHAGSYDGLSHAWERLTDWVAAQGLRPHPGAGVWEVYLTEPTPEMDPADLRTELNVPLAD